MSKGFRFWTRATLVGTLAVLMTFNPAWAGKGLRGWLKKRAAAKCCEPVITCCPPIAECCEVSCEPAAECGEPLSCDSTPVEGCGTPDCCSGTDANISEPQPAESNWNMPVVPSPVPESDSSAGSETPPPADTFEPPAPVEIPEDAGPSIVEENTTEMGSPNDDVPSSNDVFGGTQPEPDATAEQPPKTEGDLFDTPAEPTPAESSAGSTQMESQTADPPADLFSDPSSTAPATDLFDTPAESAPMEAKPAEPATDLFGEPAADAPASDLFGTPADPVPAESNSTSNDLFESGSTPGTEPPMTQEPAPANDLFDKPIESTVPSEDLFKTPADPTPAEQTPPQQSTEPMDDLFGPPSEQPAPADPKTPPKDTDDLFGGSNTIESNLEAEAATNEAANSKESLEAESKAVEETKSDDLFDDLFGARAIRNWKDNTGNFEVEAVLAEIHTDKVRLLKSNGKFCSVPMNRLSTEDREFVERVASQLPAGKVKYVAAR